ncbi:MAG: DUF4912 domain-containing protein [Spirochaetes bacterium]|nr:DUF4912 domain-containing protein [Spirochaetota bacterium]
MLNEKELKSKTLSELKKIADKSKIKYPDKIKKDDLVELILKSEKEIIKSNSIKKSNETKKNKEKTSKTIKSIQKKPVITENSDKLPDNYGKDKLILLIVNPYKGYAYWEFSDSTKNEHGLQNNNIDKYLRLYDITEKGGIDKTTVFQDIKLNNDCSSWYIDFDKPNRKYIAQIGYMKSGKFISVISSNSVVVPRDEISNEIDEKWIINNEKYKLILEASGANVLFTHDGSQELMKFLAGNIEESISSGKL